MRIVESLNMVEQFRFPKSRKKRIRKKWSKRLENWRPMRTAYVYENTVICHPKLAAALRERASQL